MKINASMTGIVMPALAAGVIYFVIAVATGASAVASIIGGIVVAAVALAIGLIVRAVYKRRPAAPTSRLPSIPPPLTLRHKADRTGTTNCST
jgi:hypothetical protein